MKISYDPRADALYIKFQEGTAARVQGEGPGVVGHGVQVHRQDGGPVRFGLLDLSHRVRSRRRVRH